MKAAPIRAYEGEAVRVTADVYEELAREGERVVRDLGLGFGGVTRLPGALKFENMIGTIATSRATIEISPKTRPGQDWMRSVLDLMDDRPIAISDDVPASESSPHAAFIDIMGQAYCSRLSAALSVEGALTTIESTYSRSPMLSGRLRVGEWIRRAAFDGHIFPVDHQILSVDNAFSRTLAYVGQILAPHISDPRKRRQMLECVDTLAGGREIHAAPANAVGLELPEQWGAYEPAWVIAQTVLKQRMRFGHRPQPYGMSLVIEPWILLERLVEKTVAQLSKQLTESGANFRSRAQRNIAFLLGSMKDDGRRYLIPDCVLLRNGEPIVNFEAKYRDYDRSGAPLRGESYQAITAGRALGTSLAVLVYPNAIPSKIYEVRKPGYSPEQLAVLGLDMFSYRNGVGEKERADQLRSLLENAQGTCTLLKKGDEAA